MNKSYYFSHDYNASNDAKILFLRQQLGMEGYGIYWFIVEQLAQAGGYLPLKIIPVLAMQTQTQETKVSAIINGYELFQIVDEQFFSQRLNDHLQLRKQLSESGKKGSDKRWLNSPPNGLPISPPNAKERKKESKEIKESKESKEPDEIVKFRIEECLTVAMNDERWVRANKATSQELQNFNDYLEKKGEYTFNPLDYKRYFAIVKGKHPDLVKRKLTIEEFRKLALEQDKNL